MLTFDTECGLSLLRRPLWDQKKAKHRFKYAVRSLRRQKRFIIRRKHAYKLAHCPFKDFWAEVGRLSKPERCSSPLVVDGVTGDKQIATLWANNLKMLYNTHSTMLRDKIRKTYRILFSWSII